MTPNPVLEELYAAREKLLAGAGGDVHRFLEGVREREAASGLLLGTTPQRTTDRSNPADIKKSSLPSKPSVVEVGAVV